MSNIELKKANQMAAIDLLINNPELNKTELANELNMPPKQYTTGLQMIGLWKCITSNI